MRYNKYIHEEEEEATSPHRLWREGGGGPNYNDGDDVERRAAAFWPSQSPATRSNHHRFLSLCVCLLPGRQSRALWPLLSVFLETTIGASESPHCAQAAHVGNGSPVYGHYTIHYVECSVSRIDLDDHHQSRHQLNKIKGGEEEEEDGATLCMLRRMTPWNKFKVGKTI
jgi:hypothetical protein